MSGFQQLVAAYLAAHSGVLPPPDPDEKVRYERDGLAWVVSVRSGGEIFTSTVDCEDLLGWLWLKQSTHPNAEN